jgi:glycogen operon protein
MILGGDEFLRTQKGNNNPWCQDNDISWVNWDLADKNADFLRFVREVIALRLRHPVLRRRRFFTGEFHREPRPTDSRGFKMPLRAPEEPGPFPPTGPVRPAEAGMSNEARELKGVMTPAPLRPALGDIHWHGVEPFQPDFGPRSRSLACSLDGRFTGREHDPDYKIDTDFYIAFNAWQGPLNFRIPPSPTRRRWRRFIDTALPSPKDFIPEGEGPIVAVGEVYSVKEFSTLVLVSEA